MRLPSFTVLEYKANPYQSQQALSASRIALPILDIPQTISVIPKELMDDAMGNRMLDAAKYVTPVVENTLPFGGEWLLRATTFDIPPNAQEPWRTKFGTLTIEVR